MDNINYLIVAKDFYVAKRFAENNQIPLVNWSYASVAKHFTDGPTIIVLNGWKRSRCILQQTALKVAIGWRKNPTVYMEETERLSEYIQ